MTRFPPDHLRSVAGHAAFDRGEAYHAAGLASVVTADADEVLAEVRGSELYRVRLRGSGSEMSGDCTCPAFKRDGWCKHLVAAALTVNAAKQDLPDRRGTIRAHLESLGAEALARMLLDLAEDDPALMRRLVLAASAKSAPATEHVKRLRQAVQAALRPRRFVPYSEAAGWASDVLDVLDEVSALITSGLPTEAKSLVEAVLDNVPHALEQVDDSGGEGTEIIDRLATLHLEACRVLRPDPLELAGELFERASEDAFGTFNSADKTYADLLGEAGLAEYYRLAEAAYARLPPVAQDQRDTQIVSRQRLMGILDRSAERAGDLDRRIALRRATLTDARDYLSLARFCLEQGQSELALQIAQDGAWLFEDRRATELVEFLAERLTANGRREDAIAALWRGFKTEPAFSLFQALAQLNAPEAADRALRILRQRQEAASKTDRWRLGALVEIELDMLMASKPLGEGWEAVRRHAVPDHVVLRLAAASEAALPEDAAAAYRGAIERQIGRTDRRGYEEACRLLKRLAGVEEHGRRIAFVELLRNRYRAKRSLIPMLDRYLAGMNQVRRR